MNFSHNPYAVNYPSPSHNTPPEKSRGGTTTWNNNPMWNSKYSILYPVKERKIFLKCITLLFLIFLDGLPPSSSMESLSVRSCPPPRPPLPEQKDYVYPSAWGNESNTTPHRKCSLNIDLGD